MTAAEYSEALAEEICFELSQGKSLVRVCKELGVEYRYVFKWIGENDKFRDNYARAREAQADYLADGILDISDDSNLPSDDRRVRIDARKWIAGKLKPKKYGDSTTIKGDKDNPLTPAIITLNLGDISKPDDGSAV